MKICLSAALTLLLLIGCAEESTDRADTHSEAALPERETPDIERADETAAAATGQQAPPPTPRTLTLADGATLAYETFGQGKTSVVMIHCWGCNRQFWRHQVAPLVDAGYRVVTVDLPGHGEAGHQRDEWRVSDYAGDMQALIEELGLEQTVLVGHSMGGPVAAMTAPLLGDRTEGIVCVDTLQNAEFEWPEGESDRMARVFEADMASALDEFLGHMFPPGTDPGLIAWIREQALAADSEALVALMRDFGTIDQVAMFEAVDVPIRCINARPEDGRGMATALETNRRYADYDVVLMEGVGHYPQLEAPERFNRHLLEQVEALTAPGE